MATKVHRPIEVGSNDAWNLAVGASKVDAVDPGDPPISDESDYLDSDTDWAIQEMKPSKSFQEKMSSVSSVTVYAKLKWIDSASSINFRITDSLGTWSGSGFGVTDSPVLYNATRTVMSDDSTAWSESALRNGSFEYGVRNYGTDNSLRLYDLWLESDYTPQVSAVSFQRMVISQMIHEMSLRHGFVERHKLPLWAFSMKPIDDFLLTHPEGPHEDGEGWKDKDWERRLLRLFGFEYDPDTMELFASCLDLRKYLAYFRDTGVCPYSLKSTLYEPDGPIRFDLGVTRTVSRASVATIADVDGTVISISNNKERSGPDGILVEDYRKEYAKNSSFKTWSAGLPEQWSKWPDCTVSQVTNNLFDAGLSTYGCRIQATTTNSGIYQADSYSWEQDTHGSYSIDHIDSSGHALKIAIKRNSDEYFYNEDSGQWQSGSWYKTLSIAAAGTIQRDHIGFDIPSGYTNTFELHIWTATGSGHDCTIYHAQLEAGTSSTPCNLIYPTSRIISEATGGAVVRESDSIYYDSETYRKIIHEDHGTIFVKIEVDYVHADLKNSKIPRLLSATALLSSGDFYLYYNSANSEYRFKYGTAEAKYASALTSGAHVIAARWCSSIGELDLPANTIDIFVDGIKGISAVKVPDTYAGGNLYYGLGLNGFVSRIWSSPFVLTDKEIKAETARIT